MGRMMLLDKECWLKHVMLDPETGLDPPNIRLRAAQGLDAADYLVGKITMQDIVHLQDFDITNASDGFHEV